MAFFDFFKGKKEKKGSTRPPVRQLAERKQEPAQSEEKKSAEGGMSLKERNQFSEKASGILVSPLITEKSAEAGEAGAYTFKVARDTNKKEISAALADLYGVKVRKVGIINIPAKKRFSRGREGSSTGYKKALVFLEKGQKIEIV